MFRAMKEMIEPPIPVEEVAAELGKDWEQIKDEFSYGLRGEHRNNPTGKEWHSAGRMDGRI